MSEFEQIVLLPYAAGLSVFFLGKLALRWSAPRKIRQTFERNGFSIIRIRRAEAWLNLGSFWRAATSAGYDVTVLDRDGHETDQFCLVRYIPIVRIARSVEIWPAEPESA